MYKIYTHAAKGLKAHVTLNQVQQLRVPAIIFAGVGDKKKKYMNYLEKNFTDGVNLYRVMCELHVIGIQNGHIALLGHPKTKAFHADVLKEFLEKHMETLNLITPYVLQHETEVIAKIKAHVPTTERAVEVTESIKKLITPEATAPAPQLTDSDKDQIWALIQADQEKSGNIGERPAELQTSISVEEKSDVQLDTSTEDVQQENETSVEVAAEPVSLKIQNSSAFGSIQNSSEGIPTEPVSVKYKNSSLSGIEMGGYCPDVKEWVNNQPYETKPIPGLIDNGVSGDPTVYTGPGGAEDEIHLGGGGTISLLATNPPVGLSFAPQMPPSEGCEVKTLMPLIPPTEGCEVKTFMAPLPKLADVNVKSFWQTPESPVKLDVKQ